jgi:hypothetical protein
MSELDKCYCNAEDSFLNLLYYQALFDMQKIKDLCVEIVGTIKFNSESKNVTSSEVLLKSVFVSRKFSEILISHFDQNDLYTIKNDSSYARLYLERWFFLVDRLIDGDYLRLLEFEDDLGVLCP